MSSWWWLADQAPEDTPPTWTVAMTRAFLDELRERARRYGWTGDYTEISEFVRRQYENAALPVPDLTPYEDDDG